MRKPGAVVLLLAAANVLSGCALLGFGGGGGGASSGGSTGGESGRLFNDEPLSKSMTYGRTKAGNFHYRYLDGTTAVACKLEGVRGDVYVEYPTREQYRLTANEQQLPETFAQPTALHLVQGGADMEIGLTSVLAGALKPGGAVDQPKGLAKFFEVAKGFFNKLLSFGSGPAAVGGAPGFLGSAARIRVVETYVRDGDMRCVITTHSAQVESTEGGGSSRAAAPAAPAAPTPVATPPPPPPPKKK